MRRGEKEERINIKEEGGGGKEEREKGKEEGEKEGGKCREG